MFCFQNIADSLSNQIDKPHFSNRASIEYTGNGRSMYDLLARTTQSHTKLNNLRRIIPNIELLF